MSDHSSKTHYQEKKIENKVWQFDFFSISSSPSSLWSCVWSQAWNILVPLREWLSLGTQRTHRVTHRNYQIMNGLLCPEMINLWLGKSSFAFLAFKSVNLEFHRCLTQLDDVVQTPTVSFDEFFHLPWVCFNRKYFIPFLSCF